MLVERLVNQHPSILHAGTVRSLALVALSLGAKAYFDEELAGLIDVLRRVRFDALTRTRFKMMEVAFLGAIGWRALVSRDTYDKYVRHLR